jgi:hypothetical protein
LTENQPIEDDEESLSEESSIRQQTSGKELFELDERNSQLLRQRAVYPRFTWDVEERIVAWVQETYELYCNRDKKQAALLPN